jgi:hypothetical protein
MPAFNNSVLFTPSQRCCLFPVALFFCFALLAGCASTSDEYVKRGSLREAVKKASDNYKGERRVEESRRIEERDRYNNYYHDRPGIDRYYNDYSITIDREPTRNSSSAVGKNESSDVVHRDSAGRIILSFKDYNSSFPLLFTDRMIKEIIIKASDTVSGKESRYFLREATPDSARARISSLPSQYEVRELEDRHYIGMRIFSGLTYSRQYSNISGGSLEWCFQNQPRRRHSVELGGAVLPANEKSDLFGSIDGIVQAFVGYKYRIYTTPDFTFMGLFFSCGADIDAISWDYKNPITSDVYDNMDRFLYTDTIKSDGLFGVGFNTGGGVSLVQTRFFRLSAETSIGTTLYMLFDTWEGFKNDMFWGDLYIKAVVEIAVRVE